jgi:AI-2 transport protein TqsA
MVIFLAMAFILIEATHIGPRFTAIHNSGGPDFSHLMQTVDDIQKYIGIKALISAVTGLLAGILCWIVGLEYAVLWGLIAFILNFIPVFGSIIAAIPATIVAFLQFGFFQGALIGLGYLAINQALGNLIEPMLMGLRFGVSTLVIFLSVIFWGWAWGPAGMFLAVPLTMVIKVSLDNTKDWRWISVAMGKKQVRGHDVLVADLLIDLETDGQTLGSGATTEWRKN